MLDSESQQLDHEDNGSAQLSPRKQQTLAGLLEGLSEKQIARRLDISRHTVHTYVKQLYVDYRVNTRSELLALWIRVGHEVACVRSERMRLADILAKLDQEVAQRRLELARLGSLLTLSNLGCADRSPGGAEDVDCF